MTGLPLTSWTPDDVAGFLHSQGLDAVAPAFKANSVSGADLLTITYDDLIGLGCSPFQAKKVQNVLAAQGVGASAPCSPLAAARPAAYAPPPPPPVYAPPTAYIAPMPAPAPSKESQELADLKAQMAREALKNDLRKEMDVAARLAATEAVQRSAASSAPSSPTVINNNNNNSTSAMQQAAAPASPAVVAAPAVAVAAPVAAAPAMVAYPGSRVTMTRQETYCGPISLIIGLFLFPCICCCPIDKRTVTVVA